MERFFISSRVLGSDKHFDVSPEGFSATDKVDSSAWILDKSFTNSSPCVRALFKLGGLDLVTDPHEKYVKAMSVVAPGFDPPWSKVLSADQYKVFVKKLIKFVASNMDEMPKEYCRTTWVDCGSVFEALRPAKIDSVKYKDFLSSSPDKGAVLETFKSGPGGYAQPVVYNRFGTRTGRLTVDSGPNILTLKREHRSVLKSSFQDGFIVSLDFSALEARIILCEAGEMSLASDLYAQISEEVFGGRFTRSSVKVAVLSELYGASKSTLGYKLELCNEDLDRFVATIRDHFKTNILREKLKRELEETGKIRNKFGRPLEVSEKNADHLIVNTYAQSTGVDVALLGFKNILSRLGTDGVRPLFVLHDALILDVREDRMRDVAAATSVAVPSYDHEFPLKLEIM